MSEHTTSGQDEAAAAMEAFKDAMRTAGANPDAFMIISLEHTPSGTVHQMHGFGRTTDSVFMLERVKKDLLDGD